MASRLEWISYSQRHPGHAGIGTRDRRLDRELSKARQPRSLGFPPDVDEVLPSGAHFATALTEIEQFGQRHRESLFGRRDLAPGESSN